MHGSHGGVVGIEKMRSSTVTTQPNQGRKQNQKNNPRIQFKKRFQVGRENQVREK